MDLAGLTDVPSLGNAKYYISFINDCTRSVWVVLLKTKSESGKEVLDFVSMVERQYPDLPIKKIHSDQGGEYLSNVFELH